LQKYYTTDTFTIHIRCFAPGPGVPITKTVVIKSNLFLKYRSCYYIIY